MDFMFDEQRKLVLFQSCFGRSSPTVTAVGQLFWILDNFFGCSSHDSDCSKIVFLPKDQSNVEMMSFPSSVRSLNTPAIIIAPCSNTRTVFRFELNSTIERKVVCNVFYYVVLLVQG